MMKELDRLTDRDRIMAKLARKLAKGRDAIYHGTRYANETLRSGKLKSPNFGERAICLTRSPETAAYFALLSGREIDGYTPAVLILDRGSLVRTYRLDPVRWDEKDKDEREERIWGRTVSFRRHLIGVIRDADVTKVLGPPKWKYLPPEWSRDEMSAFSKERWDAGETLVREGRDKVCEIIVKAREAAAFRDMALTHSPIASLVES